MVGYSFGHVVNHVLCRVLASADGDQLLCRGHGLDDCARADASPCGGALGWNDSRRHHRLRLGRTWFPSATPLRKAELVAGEGKSLLTRVLVKLLALVLGLE